MKNSGSNKIRLGIFVSASIFVFILTIYCIGKKQQLFGSTFTLCGIFKDINGLQAGNNVRFSGIDVGIISEIRQITDTTVFVEMTINENSRRFIKTNAKALIGSDGLMGNKIVILTAGTSGKLSISDKDTVETSQPATMDDILFKIKITSDNAAVITDNLSALLANIRNGKGTVGKLFMDSVFAENVDEALINIKQGAGGFKQNMDAASHNFFFKHLIRKKESEKDKNKK
jgi:phospholipid/cholesterol/gamma-HCH transport system substrate-binding protein